MNQRREKKGHTMNVLFTMLLFLVFVLCALFAVLIGSRVYENITIRSNDNFTGNTALSYVANKIRQGDRADLVDVVEIEGTQVLQMKEVMGDSEYVTWIYWKDGMIRELFTDVSSGLGLKDGLEILECGGLSLSKEGRLIHIETLGDGGGALSLSLRSGGPDRDEDE